MRIDRFGEGHPEHNPPRACSPLPLRNGTGRRSGLAISFVHMYVSTGDRSRTPSPVVGREAPAMGSPPPPADGLPSTIHARYVPIYPPVPPASGGGRVFAPPNPTRRRTHTLYPCQGRCEGNYTGIANAYVNPPSPPSAWFSSPSDLRGRISAAHTYIALAWRPCSQPTRSNRSVRVRRSLRSAKSRRSGVGRLRSGAPIACSRLDACVQYVQPAEEKKKQNGVLSLRQ